MTRTISLHSVAIVTQIVINSCSAYSPRILLSAQHSPLLYITRQQITNPFRFSSVWIVPNCDHRIDDGGEGPCLQSDCTLSVAFESWEFGICAFKLQLKSIACTFHCSPVANAQILVTSEPTSYRLTKTRDEETLK